MGRYIVLEGPDGAGKTTLHKLLKKRITSNPETADKFLFIKEPYYKDSIGMLKNTPHPMGRLGIFLQDRVRLMDEVILPAIKEGKTIVSDRSYISCEVYQYLQMKEYYKLGDAPDLNLIDFLMSMRPREFPKISHIICLTAPLSTTLERLQKRGDGDRTDEEYLTLLRKTYIDHIIRQRCGYVLLDSGHYTKTELVEETYDILVPPVGKK